ncbi:unnamed protein product [Adineta ricciae]|uniref:Uncharacterized protein n=1 Tax=Adineta ricciae TaxID=249248 RepID=A0A815SF26_ADIRI|nr:unnamed protein product [Adineta ricciae]CAF1491103.1 unnamed protein product [Adineta ricciae]
MIQKDHLSLSLCDLLHPIIHISYTIELNSRVVPCEALTITAVCTRSFDKIPADLKAPMGGTKGALQVVKETRKNDNVPHFATHKPDQVDFDLIFVNFIIAMDAIRKLRRYLNDETVRKVMCHFFYLVLGDYISQRQPEIDPNLIDNYQEHKTQNWQLKFRSPR